MRKSWKYDQNCVVFIQKQMGINTENIARAETMVTAQGFMPVYRLRSLENGA